MSDFEIDNDDNIDPHQPAAPAAREVSVETAPKEDPEIWRPPLIWLLLYPFADFDWRDKVDSRLRTAELTAIEWLPTMRNDASFTPFPDIPFTLLSDGRIRFEVLQVNEPSDVKVKKATEEFSIELPEDLPILQRAGPMREPVVSCDGRYVVLRRYRDDKILRVYTFEGEGNWVQWQPRKDPPGTTDLLKAGFLNYQHMGRRILSKAVVITVIALGFLSLLF